MIPSIGEIVVKIAWALISFLSFVYLSLISQQLLDPYYPAFASSAPGNFFACGLFFFIVSVCCSILSYFHFFLSTGPLSILTNIASASLFCFFTLSFAVCFGTKVFFNKTDIQVYQNSIVLCNTDQVLCDQFKQTIGDITMPKKELQNLATKYVQKRTVLAARKSLLITVSWIIIHSIFLNYLFHKNDDSIVQYNKAKEDENVHISDDFSNMNDVEKEQYNS